jgi:hypothetical protein
MPNPISHVDLDDVSSAVRQALRNAFINMILVIISAVSLSLLAIIFLYLLFTVKNMLGIDVFPGINMMPDEEIAEWIHAIAAVFSLD